MFKSMIALCAVLVLVGSSGAGAAGIRGDYIEARTADVYTGPCFSNAEIFIYGSQAVMAWKVTQGSYNGVDLSGLGIAAAIQGTTTFSEDDPAHARAVLIVDEKADSAQRDALVALAKSLAGRRLDNVVAIKSARISLKVEPHAMSEADNGLRPTACPMPPPPRSGFPAWRRS